MWSLRPAKPANYGARIWMSRCLRIGKDSAETKAKWLQALCTELGIDVPVDVRLLLDVARDAAHQVERPAAPLTTFIVGYAAAAQGGGAEDPRDVVGVPGRSQSRAEALRPYVYTPYWQNAAQVDARLCVRVTGDPAAMLSTLIHEVHQVDPEVPIAETITLPLQMAGIFRPLRMSATFVGYAGGLTLLLSVIGLYGALAFAVSRRRKEIGIRMALGADSRRVLAQVVAEGMTIVILGVFVGSCLAVGATRFVKHLHYAPSASDASFYAIAALVVVVSSLLACWVPARRAACLNPVEALKE